MDFATFERADDELDAFQMYLFFHYSKLGHTNEPLRETALKTKMSIGKISQVRRELAELGYIEIEDDRSGYVYLLSSEIGVFKIGTAVDAEKRIAALKGSMPFKIDTLCVIKSDDARSLERMLHQRFQDKRVNGEWFNLSQDDVDYVKSLAGGGDHA